VLFLLTLLACTPEEAVRFSPSPTGAPTTAAPTTPTPTPTRTAAPSAAPTSAAPTPTATPTTSPGGSPNVACPPRTGGSQANRALITAVRVAHNPGFDRVVFELGPNPAAGPYGLPPFTVDVASTFIATSGQPVTVLGNAFFGVRLNNTDAHDQSGRVTVAPTDIKPTTPLVREVRIVEDFEAVNRWAIGLDRSVCPTVLTLANPVRVVIDFPTPP
jgi:hypothetical protein